MGHRCFGNWQPGDNCRNCIDEVDCKGSVSAPASPAKSVERKTTKKRGRPKKTESATDVAQSDSTEIEE